MKRWHYREQWSCGGGGDSANGADVCVCVFLTCDSVLGVRQPAAVGRRWTSLLSQVVTHNSINKGWRIRPGYSHRADWMPSHICAKLLLLLFFFLEGVVGVVGWGCVRQLHWGAREVGRVQSKHRDGSRRLHDYRVNTKAAGA